MQDEPTSLSEKISELYYKEVGKFKSPTKQEERDLFLSYKQVKLDLEQDPNNQLLLKTKKDLKDRICMNYTKFVIKVANKITKNKSLLLDLIGEGNIGLLKAIDKFDVDRGLAFLTYGAYWIKVEMQEFIRKLDTVHLTSQAKKEQQQLRKKEDLLFSKGELQITRIKEISTVSFDANLHSPLTYLDTFSIWEFFIDLNFSNKEKLILVYFFGLRGEAKTLEEIGNLLYDLDGTQLNTKDIKIIKDKCIVELQEKFKELGINFMDLLPL